MKPTSIQNILLFVFKTALLPLLVLSCGSGGGGGDGEETPAPPTFAPAVFIADKSSEGVDELYAASDDGTNIVKLSNTLVDGGDVVAFLVSPDGAYVAYVADQNTFGVFELYAIVVDKTAGDTAVKISGSKPGSSGIEVLPSGQYAFDWAPNSSRIAYLADQETAGEVELFTSKPDGADNATISKLPGSDRAVTAFAWAPDSKLLAYTANQDSINVVDLYTAAPNVSGLTQKISNGLSAGQEVTIFKWAPNSSLVAFVADKNITDFFELFTTSPDNSNNTFISGSIVGIYDVRAFKWAPSAAYIAFVVEVPGSIFQLLTTFPADGPSTQISVDLLDGDEQDFEWAPDSSRVAYIADQDTPGVFELFTATPEGTDNDQVSGALVAGGDVHSFQWEPDTVSPLIAYVADQKTNNVIELYVSAADINLDNDPVSGTMAGGGIKELPPLPSGRYAFDWAPDSSRIAYIADQDTAGVFELFTSLPDGSVNDVVSGTLVFRGDVQEFKWFPTTESDSDSAALGYLADQDTDTVIELFASLPNGDDNTKLSGELVKDGGVASFDWVP